MTLSKAKDKAWKYFSLYVRKSQADINGNVRCVTCPVVKPYTEMQAGHFIPGRTNAILFAIDGVHPQCYSCNIMKHGNWPEYYKYMKIMYGLEVIDELLERANQVVKYTVNEYLDIADGYKCQVEKL